MRQRKPNLQRNEDQSEYHSRLSVLEELAVDVPHHCCGKPGLCCWWTRLAQVHHHLAQGPRKGFRTIRSYYRSTQRHTSDILFWSRSTSSPAIPIASICLGLRPNIELGTTMSSGSGFVSVCAGSSSRKPMPMLLHRVKRSPRAFLLADSLRCGRRAARQVKDAIDLLLTLQCSVQDTHRLKYDRHTNGRRWKKSAANCSEVTRASNTDNCLKMHSKLTAVGNSGVDP